MAIEEVLQDLHLRPSEEFSSENMVAKSAWVHPSTSPSKFGSQISQMVLTCRAQNEFYGGQSEFVKRRVASNTIVAHRRSRTLEFVCYSATSGAAGAFERKDMRQVRTTV